MMCIPVICKTELPSSDSPEEEESVQLMSVLLSSMAAMKVRVETKQLSLLAAENGPQSPLVVEHTEPN